MAYKKDWCSGWPEETVIDGEVKYFGHCCRIHDMRYTVPGTSAMRRKADLDLKECVEANTNKFYAETMYLGVRMFGWLPYKFNRTIFMRKS